MGGTHSTFKEAYPTGPPACGGKTGRLLGCVPKVSYNLHDTFYVFCFSYVAVSIAIAIFYPIIRYFWLKARPVVPILLKDDDEETDYDGSVSGRGSLRRYNSEAAFKDFQSEDGSVKSVEGSKGSKAGLTRSSSKGSMSADAKIDLSTDEQFIIIQGYKDNLLGTFCYSVVLVFNLFLLAIYSVLLADYYRNCQFKSYDNMCFYGDDFIFGTYYQNGRIGFVYWVVSSFFWCFWVFNRKTIRNWYRKPCNLSEAVYVNCWSKDQMEVLSTFVSPAVVLLRRLKKALASKNNTGTGITSQMLCTPAGQRYFIFRGSRYLVDGDGVMKAHFSVGDDYSDFHLEAKGMTSADAKARFELVGPNEIPFKVQSWWQLMRDEFMSFFYTYQLIMYQVWLWQGYAYVAVPLVFVVLGSGMFQVYMTRRAQLAIATVAEYTTDTKVLRDGKVTTVSSSTLVPGDVVIVPNDWLLPCDLLLIQGACVVNESALTGESMPIQKYACNNDNTLYEPKTQQGAAHTLFAGTTVLQAGSAAGEEVRAVVTATAMQTSKGELLSGILYPAQMVFKYEEELPIVVMCLGTYGVVAAILAVYFQIHSGNQATWITRWMYGVFTVSQVCSPMIGVTLNVGQLHSVERLKKNGIFSLNAKRIAISGKIRVFCFDKTGTLTKEGLDFLGVKALDPATKAFTDVIAPTGSAVPANVLRGCATCHALSKFGETFVGNEVEVKMFVSTKWELIERANQPPMVKNGDEELVLVRRFEFDHKRQTMSVVAQDKAGEYHVFVKGSFEKIGDLCDSSSLPTGYIGSARAAALDGCYVLGLASRSIGRLPQGAVASLSRDEVENSGLEFQGLILFRNELKSDTKGAILHLRDGEVRPVMITGDNAHCGYYIAKNCGMINEGTPVMLSEVHNGEVLWVPITAEDAKPLSTEALLSVHGAELKAGTMELALLGRAYRILKKQDMMDKIMWFTRIYARHTPDEKVQIVQMHAATGVAVGMCGDGGNDCGALRAAHAGVALSEAEASVVSPFTAASKSCEAVVELLREGRAALHTSFASFKFIVTYSLDFSLLKLSMLYFGCLMSNMCYIMVDCISVVALGYTLVRAKPAAKLAKSRPTSSLLGPINLASLLGTWIINMMFLVGQLMHMKHAKHYVKWPAKYALGADFWTLSDNWESSVLYLHTIMAFFVTSCTYSFGYKYRQPIFKNWPLLLFAGTLWAIHVSFVLAEPNRFSDAFHIASRAFNGEKPIGPIWRAWQEAGNPPSPGMSQGFRVEMFIMSLCNMGCLIAWQKLGAEGPLMEWIRRKYPSPRPVFNM